MPLETSIIKLVTHPQARLGHESCSKGFYGRNDRVGPEGGSRSESREGAFKTRYGHPLEMTIHIPFSRLVVKVLKTE